MSRLEADETMYNLLKPLLSLLSEEQQSKFKRIYEMEAPGILAWGVRSGYFLWVRKHPNEKPTIQQVRGWMKSFS